ncbi:MAG: site-specific integrase [Chloroflexi bacterium]|nr:site-specific integrase [Chloroflexota bacterium]
MVQSNAGFSAHITDTTLVLPAIQAWKIFLRDQGRSNHTLKAFSADLTLLANWLPTDKQIGQITTKDLEEFLTWLEKGRGIACSPKTLSRRITSLKSFFRWLSENGTIAADPAQEIIQKTVVSPLPETLTKTETELALRAAEGLRTSARPDPRPYVLLRLVLETAMKKGEVLSLMTNHLEIENTAEPYVHVRYPGSRSEYRYKERKVPVSLEWVDAYQDYANKYEIKDQVFPWSQRRLEYLLEDVTKAAKLDKHISFDMCRWTSVLNDLIDGVETDRIRQKLGISKIQWREVYDKLRQLAKDQGYDLDRLPGFRKLD